MRYPLVILQFELGTEIEKKTALIMVNTLIDAVSINEGNPEVLDWVMDQTQQAFARAYNLRAAMRFEGMRSSTYLEIKG